MISNFATFATFSLFPRDAPGARILARAARKRWGSLNRRSARRIKRLEQLVGHLLFDRTTRGVKLTLAGQLLAVRARSTLGKVQDDLARGAREQESPQGRAARLQWFGDVY